VLAPLLLGGLGRLREDTLAFGDRIDAGGQLALDLNGDTAGLVRGETLAIGSDGVSPNATSPPWWIAVLDQEDLAAGGGDLEAEAWQLGIKDDLISISGSERINSALGELEVEWGRGGNGLSGNHMVSPWREIRSNVVLHSAT
jgi:hypothetical protein